MKLLAPGGAVEIQRARTFRERTRGLIGVTELSSKPALLLKARHIHTFGMVIPIEVVFLSRDLRVLAVRSLRPNRLGPFVSGTRWIVEVAVGTSAKLGIASGVHLRESYQ